MEHYSRIYGNKNIFESFGNAQNEKSDENVQMMEQSQDQLLA